LAISKGDAAKVGTARSDKFIVVVTPRSYRRKGAREVTWGIDRKKTKTWRKVSFAVGGPRR